MSRISRTFSALRSSGRGAYIPYVCAGDPSKEFTVSLVSRLCESGADIVELGLPFSDPVADGPTIQKAMGRSLGGGFRVKDVFEITASLRASGMEKPIVLMTYANPMLRSGLKKFCDSAVSSGADAILPVDLPIEESSELDKCASDRGLDIIRLVAPTTSDRRIGEILSRASGFVYAVSVAGVTGSRDTLPESAASLLRRVVSGNGVPVVLGFGISRPEHVRQALASGASGVVEGSELIRIYEPLLDNKSSAIDSVAGHVSSMSSACKK